MPTPPAAVFEEKRVHWFRFDPDVDISIIEISNQLKTSEHRIRAHWIISRSEVQESETLQSPTYVVSNLPGIKYYLTLYPKVIKEHVKEHDVSIMLNIESKQKVTVSCLISVKSASVVCEMKKQVFDNGHKSFHTKLTTRSKLFDPSIKFFVDQKLKIELEGTLQIQQIEMKPPAVDVAPGPLSLAKALWERSDKDVTIVAEKKEIKIHKWILCGNSPVFTAEMRSGMKEALENRIDISDFSFNTVKLAVEYCYERDIRNKVNEENAYELLHFADKYDIRGFKDMLQDVLMSKVCISNVCMLANMSVSSLSAKLRECCISFLMKYAGKNTVINDVSELDDEIFIEIGRRSFYYHV